MDRSVLTFFFFSFSFFFIAVAPLVCSAAPASADLIQGCGGFVEASTDLIKSRKPTHAKFDYSHITVELRTLDGLVKDITQCAPNGYYFIPVYDKGSFVIQIKETEGWSWNPDQVSVIIDDAGCNANEDINFRFTGFTLSGKVVGAVGGQSCSFRNRGPSNVKVELLSSAGDLVSSSLTSLSGSYHFTNVIPGKYKLRASRRDLNIEVRGSTEVELGFGNGIVEDVFFVPGYNIRGSVVAQGNPILGVHMYLYSKDVQEVPCSQGPGNAPGERKALCHAVSDADGIFKFESTPCGVYELIPYYKGENTVFDVSPPFASVSVQHDHSTISEQFQVTGFSVGGRVVDAKGKGVDGVVVLVDGLQRSITDKEGYYKLDQVTSKKYLIEVKKAHYKFEKLNDFMVLPNMASVVDIKAISYDLCGVVQTLGSVYKAKVALTHGPENVKPQVKLTDDSGKFCFEEVPPGEYRLSAFAATPESAPELLFLPSHVDVTVNGPLLSTEFRQAQVNVLGSVACKEKCGSSVSISLVRLDGKSNKDRKSVALTDHSSDFLFPNVLPGKYRLEVIRHSEGSISGEDKWCWEQSFIDVDVGTEDVKGINFVQKGYWVDIVSTHDVDAYLDMLDGSRVNLKIKKGPQHICVESPGVHELHFVNSCIYFGSLSVKVDTSFSLPIQLKGEKYLLRGQIHVEPTTHSGAEQLPGSLQVDILNNEGTVVDGATAGLIANGNDQSSTAVYKYSLWANPGEKLSFVPRDLRGDGGKKILFYPRQNLVSVAQDGCQPSIPSFSGRLGLYIKGSVSPPLSDVSIRIIASEDSNNAPIKKNGIAFETATGGDGSFVGGPLYDDITYHVEASKPGYHVKAVGPYSFSCQKLGQISVRIYSKDDASEPFPPVLLSLSGEDGYRNNSIAAAGGMFLFDNLFPASFYLRPLLKEYAFSPPAQAIELGSGESREVVFHATRVAYSAMGVVSLLSGLPKEGVSIEARSNKGFYEETKTDSSGSYRLRGLQPDTGYIIKVARKGDFKSSQIERSSPESISVEVGSEDIRGLDFLVFEHPEMTILTGYVKGKINKEIHEHLRVEIRSASDPSKVESTLPLPLSNFFQVKDLPKGKHLVQLRSTLPSSALRFESDVIEVDFEKHTQIHVGPLSYSIEDELHKQELTPVPVYQLLIGVSVIALFLSMPRIMDIYQATIGTSMAGAATTAAKRDVKKLIVRKKTY